MKKTEPKMRAEYKRSDFAKLQRGQFHTEAVKGTTVVLLEPSLAKSFPNFTAVNEALRGLLTLTEQTTRLSVVRMRGFSQVIIV